MLKKSCLRLKITQRWRDDNKNKVRVFEGGEGKGGREENCPKRCFFFLGGGGICVKWVPFVKLALSRGNRAHFGSKMGLFSAFSHYVFNDCGPNRGFSSDFDLSPILTL